ncbi:hypothetical protein D9756_003349 [Leucocoprinus leucothites]|uniref:F-box domain-containing protein n=1 Tax=Leucocoprinus leucothites TaxID=201217 RepID=A0A8H5LJX2_9AGAR|nr:hypothetical protein D9756_003349 [Leucoagaricus leucothites]
MTLTSIPETDTHQGESSSSGQILPCEIWQTIIRDLPESTLWQLRELNRMLYDVVLDEMLRCTSILLFGDLQTEQTIRLLEAPGFAKRVRYLTIHNQALIAFQNRKLRLPMRFSKAHASWIKPGRHRSGRWGSDESIHREIYAPQNLLQSLGKMDGLCSVELVGPCAWWDNHHKQWMAYCAGLDCIRDALRLSSNTLTRLSLAIPLSLLDGFLGRSGPELSSPSESSKPMFLPHLEEFALELRRTLESTSLQDDAIQRLLGVTIPTFISRHLSLRALSFNVPPSLMPCLLLSPLFHALSSENTTVLPYLRSFSITSPIVSVGMDDYENTVIGELDALAHFLQRYARQLTAIQLDLQVHRNTVPTINSSSLYYNFALPSAEKWFSHTLYNISFSCLRSLDLSLMFYSTYPSYPRGATISTISDYLRPIVERGMKTLKLRDYVFESQDEIGILLNAFSFQERDGGLVELDLSVRYLSPPTLHLLAERFPRLEVLALTFEAWMPNELYFTKESATVALASQPFVLVNTRDLIFPGRLVLMIPSSAGRNYNCCASIAMANAMLSLCT